MAEKITAQNRENFGKGAARKLRAAGRIPAVVYGHGTAPVHISLPAHEVGLIVRRANAIMDLDLSTGSQLALVKDIQRDPVRQIIEHLDLIVIRSGEKVEVEVPVQLQGEVFAGTVANLVASTLLLRVEATHIPEHVVVDVEGAEDGTQITAGQVELPKGAVLAVDDDLLVVGVANAPAPEEDTEDEAEESADEDAEAPADADAEAVPAS